MRAVAALGLVAVLAVPFAARAQEYREAYAGHPLRIVAYVLHPFGVLLDRLIFRPAYWVGAHEPFTTVFGVRPLPAWPELEPLELLEPPAPEPEPR